jgi:pyruvate/2-oxoglutarate dehydrogenase complex dihydrolipoamide acyltransferase (E2) component
MQKLTLPKSGQAMEEGTIVEWNVDVGEEIQAGDPVLHFETEKMVSEITANETGVLRAQRVEAGETVPIGTVLGWVGDQDEPIPDDEEAVGTESEEAPADEAPAAGGDKPSRATPAARRAAREAGVSVDAVAAEGDLSRVTPADVEGFVTRQAEASSATPSGAEDEEILGSPRARVVAEEEGVDIVSVGQAAGTDRVREADVYEYVESRPEAAAPGPAAGAEPRAKGEPAIRDEQPIVGGEAVMFEQMSRVAQNYASTTTAARVDVTELLDLYEDLKATWTEEQGDSVSLTAFVARAVAQTLPEFPRLNAEYRPDEELLRTYADVNLGVAVNSDDGLIVPTIYHADDQSVRELSRSIDDLVAKVEDRRLEESDLANGTFSISNAGSLGAYINTPQINPPQTAILGMCKIFEDPGVVDGEVVPRKFMHLCLSYDHRVVEGATAVTFLQTVKSQLEAPTSLLS